MRRSRSATTVFAGLLAGLPAWLGAPGLAVADDAPLAAYAWSARPFLVFADASEDADLVRQRAQLASHAEALAERVVPVIVVADGRVEIDGAPAPLDAERLRRWYDAPRGRFRVLLIGKDTGVKLDSPRPVSSDALFALIDAMPMRRREMRRQTRGAE